MSYTRIDFQKRCQIYGLYQAGHSYTRISQELDVHKSTISREIRHNVTFFHRRLGNWRYKPQYAQYYTEERQKKKPKRIKFNKEVEALVREKLLQEWNPEQISGYAKKQGLFSISHERIYQFIMEDKKKGGILYKHLRHQHKKYRKRY